MARILLRIAVILLVLLQDQCSGCPPDWSLYDGICYRKFSGSGIPKNWADARTHCQTFDSDLAIANTSEIMDHLQSMGGPINFYIGLNDIDTETVFVWVDDTMLDGSYTPFERSKRRRRFVHPFNSRALLAVSTPVDLTGVNNNGNRDCVRVKTNINWKVLNCAQLKNYACGARNVIDAINVTTSNESPYPGQPITFSCNVTLAEDLDRNDLVFQWQGLSGNGLSEEYSVNSLIEIEVQCMAGININFIYVSSFFSVQPIELPAPTLVLNETTRVFLNHWSVLLTCESAVEDVIYPEYNWLIYDLHTTNSAQRFEIIPENVPQHLYYFSAIGHFNYSCKMVIPTHYATQYSDAINVIVIELNPPTVLQQDSRNIFFIGNTYDFVCSSPHEAILDDEEYLWKVDDTSDVVSNDFYTISFVTEIENISCAIRWESEVSEYSYRLNASVIHMPVPTVISFHERVYFVGNTYTFDCSSSLDEYDFLNYTWTVNGTAINGTSKERDIAMTMEGIHEIKCALQDMNVTSFSDPFNVSVIEMPKPSISGSHIYFVNQTSIFTCVSPLEEEDIMSYQWLFNGIPDDSQTDKNFSIVIGNVDTFTIACVTVDDLATAISEDVNVHVIELDPPTVLHQDPRNIFFVGNTHDFVCSSPQEALLDDEEYLWKMDDISDVVLNDSYTISFVTEIENISCAIRWESEVSEYSYRLNASVIHMPIPTVMPFHERVYFVGNNYTFSCSSSLDEYDFLNYPWTVNGTAISGTSKERDIAMTMEGIHEIKCALQDMNVTSFSDPFNVSVIEMPKPSISGSHVYLVNQTSIFTCVSPLEEEDIMSYQWFFNGIPDDSQTDKNFSIVIGNVDTFTIACVTVDDLATAISEDVNVHVIELDPPTVLHQDPRNIFFIGNTHDFVCSSPHEALLDDEEYLWKMDDISDVVSNNSYAISFVSEIENISCAIRWESEVSEYSYRLNASVIHMPIPTVMPYHERVYFVGNIYTFSCSSSLDEYDFLNYPWTVNGTAISGTSKERDIAMTMEGIHEIKCALQEMNVTSFSNPFTVSVIQMPQPSLFSSQQGSTYFVNQTSVFTCVSPLEEEDFTNYLWFINEALVEGNTEVNLTIVNRDVDRFTISCGTVVELVTAISEAIDVHVIVMPPPTVLISGHGLYFFVDNDYSATCSSPVDGESISSYEWDVNTEYEIGNPESNIMVHLESVGPFHFTCATRSGVISVESDIETIQSTAVPVPIVEVLGLVNTFLIGSQYTFLCQSEVSTFVTAYTFNNTDVMLPPQPADNSLVIMATEEVQEISCAVTVDNSESAMSDEFIVSGSDIVSVSAQVSNLNPFPGTNVTFTCTATMVDGYTEDDVTFRWDEFGATVATTKSHTKYVVPGMVMLTLCEASTRFASEVSNILNIGANELPMPTLNVDNERESGIYEVGHFYTLSCQSEPVEDIITQYRWLRDGQMLEENGADHMTIQAMSTYHNYTCAYRINDEISETSELMPVMPRSIESVQIENDGDFQSEWGPVIGAILTLTCQTTVKPRITHEPIYRWFTEYIDVGSTPQYTMTSYLGYRQILRCELIVGDDIVVSEPVTVAAQETPSPPFVLPLTDTGSLQIENFQEGESYTLDCFSNSKSDNSTVTWSKNGLRMPCVTEPRLEIKRFRSGFHSGNIQCTIHVSGMESESVVFNLN